MEGWYTDPFKRYEARWISEGNPTSLVRDGTVEGSDPVANGPIKITPVRIEVDGPHDGTDGTDGRRADDPERGGPFDPDAARTEAFDTFDQGTDEGS